MRFEITVFRDDDAGVWIARNEDIPLVSEAASYEALVARVWEIAPEIIVLNGHARDETAIRLRCEAHSHYFTPSHARPRCGGTDE